MNPWAMIEGIPGNAHKITVYFLHGYGANFKMDKDCKVNISMMSSSDIVDEGPVESPEGMIDIKEVDWPLATSDD